MTKHLIGLTMVFALLATACGDDGGSGGTSAPSDPRGQEIVDLLLADGELPMTEAEANCTANNMLANLDDTTIDLLIDNTEIDLDELPNPQDAIDAFDAVLDCIDVEQIMVDQFMEDGTDETTARCIADAFGEDELRTMIASSALPGDAVDEGAAFALLGRIFEAAQTCGLDG